MKRKPDSDIDLMARGPSFERMAWLANMLRMANRREFAEPTDDDIREMRKKIGGNPLFAKLSDANKAELFRVIVTVRQRLRIYERLPEMEEEDIAPLLRVLADFVATVPNYHGLLTVAVDEMSGTCGTTVGDGWQTIIGLVNIVESLREIVEGISEEVCQRRTGKPKVYDKRTIRRLRQRYETIAIRDCLRALGINISKTGPGDHKGKGDDALELMANIIHYTSGAKPSLDALRTRLTRVERD
jgi:hypothetical protein